MTIISSNNNVNNAINNIINIIKNIYLKNPLIPKIRIAKLLGLSLYESKSQWIISQSLKDNNHLIFLDININDGQFLIKQNLLIIYKEIINILIKNKYINQTNLSIELGFNSIFDHNQFITYLFIELLNKQNIIEYIKIQNQKLIFIKNNINNIL